MSSKKNILLCCTGSVATIKVLELYGQLSKLGDVRIVLTTAAMHFAKTLLTEENSAEVRLWEELKAQGRLFTDEHEWSLWQKRGNPVMHIDLRNWVDIAVIAPLDANTLAKLAVGLSDNLVSCIFRAWDFSDKASRKRIVACPAMNPSMWAHPHTARHMRLLHEVYNNGASDTESGDASRMQVVLPICKTVICGETGVGAMASLDDIVAKVSSLLAD